MICLSREQHETALKLMAEIDAASNPVLHVEDIGLWSRADLRRASGISGPMLKALSEGKRIGKAQMAALKFAALCRLMGLNQ